MRLVLKKLGLTANEVEIYLTLISVGEITAYKLAGKSGLHRQVCYDALERLLEKGFVSYVLIGKTKHFKAMDPEKIHDYLDEKKLEFDSVLPKLKEMYLKDHDETQVEVIKGKLVLRNIYTDIFKTLSSCGGQLCAMGIDEELFLDFDPIAIKQHIAKMQRAGFVEKLLSRESAVTFFEGKQSKYKLLPDNLFNPNPTHIYGDKVALILWGQPMHGIVMHSKAVADAYRKYFEILWSMAKARKK